jgi:DNA primase
LKWTPNAADDYLKQRAVPADVVQKYGFGYAPPGWDYIVTRLGRKYGEQRLEQVGLAMKKKEGNGYYDRFRNRLIIPIHSETGALVGFGGRTLDGKDPKYLNSPESELFNKSRLLYNLHRSKDAMRRIDRAILVEGYFDAIAIDHAGVPGVIASMGTSLTTGQSSLLRRFTTKVVIAYDGDDAGRNATLRAAEVLLAAGLTVSALDLQGEKDPDSLIQKHGTDRFLEVLSNATDIFDFALREWATDAGSLSGREKSDRVQQFVPLLSAVNDPVMRNDAAQRIADAFHLQFDVVWSRVRGRATSQPALREVTRAIPSGEKFVLTAAIQGRIPQSRLSTIDADFFVDPDCRTIFSLVKTEISAGRPIDYSQIQTHLRAEAELTLLSEVTLTEDLDDGALNRLDQILGPMQKGYIQRRSQDIQREAAEAKRNGDSERELLLQRESLDLMRMLNTLK